MSPSHHLWVHDLLLVHPKVHLRVLIGAADPEILLGVRVSANLSIPHIIVQRELTSKRCTQMLWRKETCDPRSRSWPFIHVLLHWHRWDLSLRWVSVHGGHSGVGHGVGHVSRYIEGLKERNRVRCGRHVEDWKRVRSIQGWRVDRQLAGVNKHLIDC